MPDRRHDDGHIDGEPPNGGGRGRRIVVNANQCFTLLRFRGDLLRSLVDAGHEVIVTIPEATPGEAERLSGLGVRHEIVAVDRSGLSPARDLAYAMALRRLYLRTRPDIAFSIMVKPAIYGSLTARSAGVPRVVAMLTGLGYAFEARRSVRQRLAGLAAAPLVRAAFRGAHAVIFHNTDDRDLLVARGLVSREQCRDIDGSGVDLDHFAPSPLPGAASFLVVARLLQAKGIGEYIDAARRVKREFPEALFRLAGPHDVSPDALDPALLSRAVAEGVIDYLGDLDDVRRALRDARVVVLPSYREGRPRSLQEAMAMARPVITTDVPGCRATVTHGVDGLLVPPRDAEALAEAMRGFCRDPGMAERMAPYALAAARTRFDVRDINRRMIGFILGERDA